MPTVAGLLGLALSNTKGTLGFWMVNCVSAVNILTGLIQSVHRLTRAAEKSESHTNTYRQYATFVRSYTMELSILHHDIRDSNEQEKDLLRVCRLEYERLQNLSPEVPTAVLLAFR